MEKNYHTLTQVCRLTGVSRRAIQGYEKAGLVSPCGKQANGYLLYDQHAIARIALVKLLQELKFSLSQIVRFLEQDTSKLEREIHNQIVILKQQGKVYDSFLQKTDQFADLLCDEKNSSMVIEIITQLKNSKI